jgi:hypothetical protein
LTKFFLEDVAISGLICHEVKLRHLLIQSSCNQKIFTWKERE